MASASPQSRIDLQSPTTTAPTGRGGTRTAIGRRGRWRVEILLFAGVLLVYQLSRAFVIGDATNAFANALNVIHLEKASGLFFETHVQAWMLEHLRLTQILNQFYIWAHLPVTGLFFVWLYRRRREAYSFVRNAFFLTNLLALTVFVAFPVAPPRMMEGHGFVDTLSIISGIDLHAGNLSGWFNPYAAVPSMHFGYALMVGAVTALLAKRIWVRALAVAYPGIVFFTIVGTANHFVIDALAGGIVLITAFLVTWTCTRLAGRSSQVAPAGSVS